ncbi:MAG: GNAT family N-acetyltransferase [Chloroflexota bacterium]
MHGWHRPFNVIQSSPGLIELRHPELLDTRRHQRDDFDSGEPTLDQWLLRYAGQNRRGNTAATWVIATEEDVVVAYASLAMTGIDRSGAPRSVTKTAPDPVPALLIGRLAVDRRYAAHGIGTALVAHVLATAVELNAKAALRAVVVAALHDQSHSWWEHLGFTPFDPNDPRCLDLHLLTDDIEETLRSRTGR